jgi:S-adenosylmethionine hydrolase
LKPIITLTTYLGYGDYYLSMIKAKIYSQGTDFQIIDISHEIDKFNLAEAAFVLKSVMPNFPKGTIHIIGVSPGAVDEGRHLVFSYLNQFIITADNGFFSLIADHHPDMVVELNIKLDTDEVNFPTRDLYAPAAALLARGVTLEVIGNQITDYQRRAMLQPVIGDGYIKGAVTYIDNYGNAICNISKELFVKIGKGRGFIIGFVQRGYDMNIIDNRYSDASEGDRLALFNSAGLLEISINHGNASNLLGLEKGETIIISFDD